jgi:hypothetical protein
MTATLTCDNLRFTSDLSTTFKKNSRVEVASILLQHNYYLVKKHLLLFFCLLFTGVISAQTVSDPAIISAVDSLRVNNTSVIKDTSLPALQTTDSFSRKPVKDSIWKLDPSTSFSTWQLGQQILQRHPWLGFKTEPLTIRSDIKKFQGKEILFYSLIVLLLVFALLRQAFPKYFSDLFRLFFRTTIKQRQIKEQLMQTPLPSLLLNGLFVVSGGLYINLLLDHYRVMPVSNFWLSFVYCIAGLSGIYFLKFIGLKLSGWLFSMREAADSYIFIVFVVNKIIGIVLLPFLIMLAFMKGEAYSAALVLSWCFAGVLLIYRLVLTYAAVRNQIKVNPFHFFLYLCAFEFAPILLLYKGLLVFLRQTA